MKKSGEAMTGEHPDNCPMMKKGDAVAVQTSADGETKSCSCDCCKKEQSA